MTPRLGRDRLGLVPLALPGVGVDPGQHPPGAEFLLPVRVGEAAAQRETLVLQPDEGECHVGYGQRGGPGQVPGRGRAPDVQVAAEHLGRGRLGVHGAGLRAFRRDPEVGVQRVQHGLPFGGAP
jgi:hypothetical protein